MTQEDHIKADAKRVENHLRAMGDHMSAQAVTRLRKAYASRGGMLKQLHADNMALREGAK